MTHHMTIEQIRALAPSAFAQDAHESRSDRYTYVPTSGIIEQLLKTGFVATRAQESRTRDASRRGFTKHLVAFRHPDMRPARVGDSFPEVLIRNSHDGGCALEGMLGVFRLVCSNGMIVAAGATTSFKVRHTGNVTPQVLEGATMLVEQAKTISEAVDTWAGITLTRDQQMAFAEAAHELRFGDASETVRSVVRPLQLLGTQRADDRGDDLWRVFNRVQEHVVRGGMSGISRVNGERRRVTARAVTGIDQGVDLNRGLWALGERTAELLAA